MKSKDLKGVYTEILVRLSVPLVKPDEEWLTPLEGTEGKECICHRCLQRKVVEGIDISDLFLLLEEEHAEVVEILPWPVGDLEGLTARKSAIPMPIDIFLENFLIVLTALVAEWELRVGSKMGSKQLTSLAPTLGALLKVLGVLEGVITVRSNMGQATAITLGSQRPMTILEKVPVEVLRNLAWELKILSPEEANLLNHAAVMEAIGTWLEKREDSN